MVSLPVAKALASLTSIAFAAYRFPPVNIRITARNPARLKSLLSFIS
jgi:hypothetical protein